MKTFTPSGPLLFVVLAFALLASACGENGEEVQRADSVPAAETVSNDTPDERRIVRVNTLTIEPSRFEEVVQLTGSVDAPNDARLSAQTSGTITRLVVIGTHTNEGDVVARLDDRLVKAALEQARAALSSAMASKKLAEDTFRRQEPLYRDSIISALEYENIRTQLNQADAEYNRAKAAVKQAEQQLEYTYIRAPFDGTVEERFAEKGEQVMPGSPVVRIVGLDSLKIIAGVPERYASDIKPGTRVDVRFKSYDASPRTETVSFVGNVINPQNRTFRIEVDLDNAEGTLKPEMIADLHLTRRVLTDRIVVPQSSVLRDENGYSVYVVVRKDNQLRAQRRTVDPGPSFGGETVINDGLEVGDDIIVTGQNAVTGGDAVEIATG